MNLKSITFLAVIGQIIELVYWQSTSLFHLYRVFGEGFLQLFGLLVAVVGHGSLILFLFTLYSRQK